MTTLFKYSKLFSLELMHLYYKAFRTADFSTAPDRLSAELLKKYELIFRQLEFGFDVFAGTGQNGQLKKEVDKNLKFTFFLFLDNPYFVNFSSLPIDQQAGQKFYFNNKVFNQVDVFGLGLNESLLNQGANVSEDDLIRVNGPNLPFSYNGAGTDRLFQLLLEDNDTYLAEKSVHSDTGLFEEAFLLNGFPPGVYRLESEGEQLDRFYYNDDSRTARAFGIIEIFTDVPDDNKFILNTKDLQYISYKIAFLNRSTRWRYKVSNRNSISLPDPAIAVGDDIAQFSQTDTLEFTSVAGIGLKEEPNTEIRILKNSGDLNSDALANLPNAGIEQILPVKNNGSYTIYSDIFIYL